MVDCRSILSLLGFARPSVSLWVFFRLPHSQDSNQQPVSLTKLTRFLLLFPLAFGTRLQVLTIHRSLDHGPFAVLAYCVLSEVPLHTHARGHIKRG